MLLRRFVSNITDQKWSAIVVELVIVIAGVFIGLQAANWNADRLEQREGRLISARLLADLRKDLASRQDLVSYYQVVFESAERTEQRLRADSIDDTLAFVVDAYRATEYAHRPATRATYDEIVSTGRIGLIPPAARQAGFGDYFRYDYSASARAAVRASPYRHRVRRLLPNDVQAAIRARCSDIRSETYEVTGFVEHCDLGLPTERLHAAAAALRSDPETLPDLRFHLSELNATTPNFRGEVLILEESIKALENTN